MSKTKNIKIFKSLQKRMILNDRIDALNQKILSRIKDYIGGRKNRKITVTDFADLIGVARPTMSNYINGKARLSKEMIYKLHVFFMDKIQGD